MAKKEEKQKKDKKNFIKDFKAELKKVSWPTPKQLINNTAIVVVIVLITAIIVFVLDFVFNFVHESGVTKLQTVVQEKFSNTSENKSDDDRTDSSEQQENIDNENTSETNEQSNEVNQTGENN